MTPQETGEEEVAEEEEELYGYIEVMVQCPFCKAYVPDDFECLKCGAEMFEPIEEESTRYLCSNCGEEVDERAEECPSCGTILS